MLILLKNNQVKFKNGQIFSQYHPLTNYYTLVVNNGIGDGNYPSGTVVGISGNLSGTFLYWTGDVSTIADISGQFTTIEVNDNYTITATYAGVSGNIFFWEDGTVALWEDGSTQVQE